MADMILRMHLDGIHYSVNGYSLNQLMIGRKLNVIKILNSRLLALEVN